MALRVRRHHVGVARRGGRAGLVPALALLAIALLLPLATFLVSVWLGGWQLQAVQSGSMEPTYRVGSVLVVEPIDASEVRRGMPLVFEDPMAPGRLVIHRMVERAPGDAVAFWTQGDANAARDPVPVPARMVRGKVKWQVTGLGTLLTWLRWPRSGLLLVVVPAALLVATEWRDRRRRRPTAQVVTA